jgi:hypothetical protein
MMRHVTSRTRVCASIHSCDASLGSFGNYPCSGLVRLTALQLDAEVALGVGAEDIKYSNVS